jgi:alkylation response protein AidB-like acyl-CoA dehydrogenase
MNFALTDEQEALRDLARTILADHVTHEHLKQLEERGEWFDERAWSELGKARLLGVGIPEEFGGSGLGFVEICLLLEEIGRAVAPVPAVASLVLGALAVAEIGNHGQQRALLSGVSSGDVILSAALTELAAADPHTPLTTARRDGASWRLDGSKTCVPAAELAHRIVVPARTGQATVGLFLVDPRARGVTLERQILTNGEPHARMSLSGAAVAATDVLGDPMADGAMLRWLLERATVAYCVLQVGVCDRALRMAAEYTTGREQFGRPIASFQAVHQRAADAYIDLEAIRLSAWEAAWRLAEGLPAEDHVRVAKFWAADGGQRVAVAAQHLHGGIGVDMDYPLHRYFTWAKHIELVLGGAMAQLAQLGSRIAGMPGR